MKAQRAQRRLAAATIIRPGAAAVATALAASLALTGPLPSAAAPGDPDPQAARTQQQPERMGNLDSRVTTLASTTSSGKQLRRAIADRNRLVALVGGQSLVSIDPLTGTPSHLSRLDGYLTASSTSSARSVALAYVRRNLSALGLGRGDVESMSLNRDYVDVAGIHHLSWIQSFQGIRVFGNGLKANVSKSGRLISIQGAPVPGSLLAPIRADPRLSAADARKAAAADVGGTVAEAKATTGRRNLTTRWSNHDYAKQVWFLTPKGLRLAYSTYVQAGGTLNYQHVIDANTGEVLYRKDLVANERGDALVYKNYPGAVRGGTQTTTNFVERGWLSDTANTLSGRYVNAWADVNATDDQRFGISVDTPGVTGAAQYELSAFPEASTLCGTVRICTWNPATPLSWLTNLDADSTQAFYMGSQFHDYLLKAPIGFTSAAGNFEAAGGDALQIQGLDGANTDNGLPDAQHINNANMSTPPDGIAPTMQMYLFHVPGATAAQDPALPASATFDPSILLHEYIHGLSGRLVVDVEGSNTLNTLQAGSMGEAWSDYYALDFLAARKVQPDPAGDGNLRLGSYIDPSGAVLRTQPIDCPVASAAPSCAQPLTGVAGGYTYANLAAAIGTPEVHGTGELWAQTLWDIRTELGRTITNTLVTRAMELSPADPSMLDMRNAILQADRTIYAGKYASKLWAMFAERGMGYFAGTLDSADGAPGASFARPPRTTATATLSGVVDPGVEGRGLAGAVVDLDGSVDRSVIPGSYQAVTDTDGAYRLTVPVGSYPEVLVTSPGYERVVTEVTVGAAASVKDFSLRRIWSSSAGGASVVAFNGPDYSDIGCGPADMLDAGVGEGWSSTTGDDAATPTDVVVPKSVTIELPTTVDIYTLGIDPSATCGSSGSSSTGDYRVEASANRTEWTTIKTGTFVEADRQLKDYPVGPVTGVRYVRVTLLSPQVPNFATNCPSTTFTGCRWMDMTDFRVYGRASE